MNNLLGGHDHGAFFDTFGGEVSLVSSGRASRRTMRSGRIFPIDEERIKEKAPEQLDRTSDQPAVDGVEQKTLDK